MSAVSQIEIVALADSVLLPLAEKATGLTVKAMNQYIENGLWSKGKEYEVGEDGQPRMNMAGFYAWVKNGIQSSQSAASIEPIPEVQTSLYRHFDERGALLYVGISLCAIYRLAQHLNSARWAARITTITIEKFPSREAAYWAETEAIAREKPEFNIAKVYPCPT